MSDRYLVKLSEEPLELVDGVRFVTSPKCGAINSFLGLVRDLEESEPIRALFYEAFEPMAAKQITKILESALKETSDCRAFVAVRLGLVPVGQASIHICVSSPGRHWSHGATLEVLNRIKSSVVIWKKALYCDGREQWIGGSKSEAWWLTD